MGAPQLDELVEGMITSPEELAQKYDVDVKQPYFLVVQHPVTEEMDLAGEQLDALTEALSYFDAAKVWIMPNNDAGSQVIRRGLRRARKRDTFVFDNMTRRDYLGLMARSACMIGNSSSGILEAPTFQIPAVNLGRRQADRVHGKNVIDAAFKQEDIRHAIKTALSAEYRESLSGSANPYGDGRSSARILDILGSTPINDHLLIKTMTY